MQTMICAIAAAWLALLAGTALAQPDAADAGSTAANAAPSQAPAAPELTTLELVRQLDNIATTLAQLEADLPRVKLLTESKRALDELDPRISKRLAGLNAEGVAVMTPIGRDSLLQELQRLDAAVAAARAPLDERTSQLQASLAALRAGADLMERARSGGEAVDIPDAIRQRMAALARQVATMRSVCRRALDVVLAASDRAATDQQQIAAAIDMIDDVARDSSAVTLVPEQPPIWETLPGIAEAGFDFDESIAALGSATRDVLRLYPWRCLFAVLLLVAAVSGILALRRAALEGPPAGAAETEAGQLFIRHPVAAAVLIWSVIAPDVVDLALPSGVAIVRIVVVVASAWLLLPLIAPPAVRGPLRALLVLSIASTWLTLLLGPHPIGSIGFVLIGALSMVLFRRLSRAIGPAPTANGSLRDSVARAAAWTGFVLAAAGACAVVVGSARLGRQLIEGVLVSTLLPVVLAVASQVLRELWDQILESAVARRLRAVRAYPDIVRRRGHQLVNLALVLLALPLVIRVFPFMAPLWGGLAHVATARLVIGGISLSLLDVITLGLGVTLTIVLSRFGRFVLDEDIMPRLPVAPGAAAAASHLIYYLLLTVGVLMALAAAGFELSQLTLLVSAFGVGIGFGLQNIVNNFVSGIVLAFERPFHSGDLIAVGDSTGRVRKIGLRATTVKTAEGAEVIVPNSTFISGEVTNWTLSDRMRRIEIPVGVAYGSDPRQVQALLHTACGRITDLAREPEPLVVFSGFGDSSLNFKVLVWTPDAERLLVTTSELAMAIHDALRDADIEIPFPQRDIHIRSGKDA